jgi:hypothetical protein
MGTIIAKSITEAVAALVYGEDANKKCPSPDGNLQGIRKNPHAIAVGFVLDIIAS